MTQPPSSGPWTPPDPPGWSGQTPLPPPQPVPPSPSPPGPAYADGPAPGPAHADAPAPGAGRLIGALLLVPALIALLLAYVIPTIGSILDSFQRKTPLSDASGKYIGFDNYGKVFDNPRFGAAVGFTLLLVVLPLLTLVVIGPVVAWLAHRSGGAGRRITRLVLVPLLVIFSPIGVALAWLVARRTELLRDSPRLGVTLIVWLVLFGALLAVSVTVFLAVLRRRAGEARPWSAALVVAAVFVLATLAYGLQSFDVPYMLTGRGPRGTATLLELPFEAAFVTFNTGYGAAGLTLVGIVVGLLGIAAVLLVALSGLRVRWTAGEGRPASAGATVGVVAALVACLAVVVYTLWPWFANLGNTHVPGGVDTVQVTVNTWLPSLISAIVGVLVAALAGFGIGALRPLGRLSELLLLPFAPWLFVTPAMQAFSYWDAHRSSGGLNTFLGLIPPVWVNIPALVLFTILFRGLSRGWRAAAVPGAPTPGRASLAGSVILPALPMAAVAVAATWLLNAQSLMWPLVIATDRDHAPGPLTLLELTQTFSMRPELPVRLALPITAVVIFGLAAAALQWWYLDRLSIRAGQGADAPDNPVAPGPGVA